MGIPDPTTISGAILLVRHDSGAFLTRISDTLVDLGPGGIHLTSLTLAPAHQATFTRPEQQTALRLPSAAEAFPLAEPPSGSWFVSHEQRRHAFWQPAPTAPSFLHCAWLLNELGEELNTLEPAGLTFLRAEAPQPESVDLVLVHRRVEPSAEPRLEAPGEGEIRYGATYQSPEPGQLETSLRTGPEVTYRVRIQLQDRQEPLEFPVLFLRELFEENRYPKWMAAEETELPLVDLRGVL
ncbi:hypothetical protein [Streptomyces sp. NPDC048639]|uniref:hypothetical protein n=1 Tax=Streptomyces sp. NPDC048639 TaxID=3365581 RepID=UPI00371317FF